MMVLISCSSLLYCLQNQLNVDLPGRGNCSLCKSSAIALFFISDEASSPGLWGSYSIITP